MRAAVWLAVLAVAIGAVTPRARGLPGGELQTGAGGPQAGQRPPAFTLTALANAGVLIDDGRQAVVIDGLFRDGIAPYATLPDKTRNALERGVGPFARVAAVLVTHWHGDHFDAAAVATHLRRNPHAVLVVAEQVAERVRAELGAADPALSRVRAVTPQEKGRSDLRVGGVDVTLVRLRHNPSRNFPTQHVGQAVRLGGRLVLHVGDADPTADNFRAAEALAPVDVALVPFWYVISEDGRRILREQLRSKRVVALHVPPADAPETRARVSAAWPGAFTITEPGQTLELATR
jgi:L-ascorbate metabolism protein UlaG (beta-lactamase superfamily)